MATEARRDELSSGDESTLAGEEWPVAEHYRVPPIVGEPDQDTGDAGHTVILQQAQEPAARTVRRFPPDVGPRFLIALIAALLLIPGAIWLASNALDDSSAASTAPGSAVPQTTSTTSTAPESTSPAALRAVPDVVGLTIGAARTALEEAGFRVRVRGTASEGQLETVLGQSPGADEDAPPNSIVVLTVSMASVPGAGQVRVPRVVGLSASRATQLIREAGLEASVRRVRSAQPAGTVLEQVPAADAQVDPRSVLRLQVAIGPPTPAMIAVPGLIGLVAADARRELRELGLRWTLVEVPSEQPRGTVVGQSPRVGAELRKGGLVTLRVSTGPASVAVPDVVGLDEASARGKLEAAGFEVRVVDEPTTDPSQDGAVVSQDPAGSSTSRKGTVVTVTIARLG